MSGATTVSVDTAEVPQTAWRLALDGLAVPVFLLRPDGAIVHCNQFGDAFLRAGRVFRRYKGRLSVRRQRDDDAWMTALLRSSDSRTHELLRLRQRTGEVSCLVHLDPVPGHDLVVVSIAELRLMPDREPGWSGAVLGLREVDAGLSESLASGQSLQEIADRTGTPVGTLRTRLKKLFTRTGTDTQTRLAATLLRGGVLFLERQSPP